LNHFESNVLIASNLESKDEDNLSCSLIMISGFNEKAISVFLGIRFRSKRGLMFEDLVLDSIMTQSSPSKNGMKFLWNSDNCSIARVSE
jgi:hypothetical protein